MHYAHRLAVNWCVLLRFIAHDSDLRSHAIYYPNWVVEYGYCRRWGADLERSIYWCLIGVGPSGETCAAQPTLIKW